MIMKLDLFNAGAEVRLRVYDDVTRTYVASQAPKNPTEVARPNVYDRSRCDGISPPDSQAYGAIIP